MKRLPSILPMLGAAMLAAAAQAQMTPDLTGRWTQESGGKELVLAPKIKLQPNVGVGYGTNLGGSVGYGSMTRTTIVTEPTMMDVNRAMTLAIEADGRFKWTITKRHADGDRCVRTSTQVKQGKAQALAGKMVFAVAGGTEEWSTSCGRSGSSKIAAASESYDMTVQGNVLRLASGPSRWTFARG